MRTSFLSFFFSVLLLLFFSACEEENIAVSDDGNAAIRLTALLPDVSATRTTYTSLGVTSGVKVDWEEGDELVLYGVESEQVFTFTYSQELIGGTHWTYTDASFQEGEPLVGIYTAASVKDNMLTVGAEINFDNQDGTLENLKNYDLMISAPAIYTNHSVTLEFKHICTFLRIAVSKDLLPSSDNVSMQLWHAIYSIGYYPDGSILGLTKQGSAPLRVNCAKNVESDASYYYYYLALAGTNYDPEDPLFIDLLYEGKFIRRCSIDDEAFRNLEEDPVSFSTGSIYLVKIE